MKQQHGTYDTKKYNKGINSDINKELMGLSDDGSHVDALNMRSLSQDGTNLGKKHIGGESTYYFAIDNRYNQDVPVPTITDFGNYACMMAQSVGNKIVEIWCSKLNISTNPSTTEPSFIRIDGTIYLMSFDFPVFHDRPLQYDKNQHALGGEIYITDFHAEPMIFNVEDLIDSYETQKYFGAFNLNQYTITLESNLYKPQFIDLVNTTPTNAIVIGSTGLPVGQYSYSYRYVSSSGDFSSFAPLSDLIPVVIQKQEYTPLFNMGTTSTNADLTVFSTYAPYIKVRFVNNNNFASIQIVRHAWNSETTLDTQPISYIIHTHDISSITGMGVFSFVDKEFTSTAMTAITYSEANADVTSIEAAKSIRFYNRRLYLMNLKYKSKDTEATLNFDANNTYLFPTIQKIYREGHANTYNAATYKSYMRGERQGYGVLLYDNNGSPTYVTSLPTSNPNNSYHHPNRRELVSSLTKGTSYEGVVTATLEDNTIADLTHEVFDHERGVSRGGNLSYDIAGASPEAAVLHPTGQNDTNLSAWEVGRPNITVSDFFLSDYPYDPKGFGLDYYSLGVGIKDIKIPAGFSGFSIVKTQPAKRILAQGVAFYDFGSSSSCNVYFPDLDKLDPIIVDQLSSNSNSFQLEVVSALGFFSELYSGSNGDGTLTDYSDTGIDMITYARILHENGSINPSVSNGHVKYDSWIKTSDADLTNKIFDINTVTEDTVKSGKMSFLTLNLTRQLHHSNGNAYGNTPLFIVNLIRNSNDIADDTIVEYTSTGHFQKAQSLIGKLTSQTPQSFPLISERWEDCINQPFATADNAYNAYAALDKYIYIEDNLGALKAWINVTYKSTSQITPILDAITNNGFYQSSLSEPKVYGVYKDNAPSFSESLQRNYEIVFDYFDTAYNINLFIPLTNESVYVMYDSRVPSRVFGGDTFINECIWAYQDNEYSSSGTPNAGSDFNLGLREFPYYMYTASPNMYMYYDTSGSSASFMSNRDIATGHIRQLINMFTAETRVPLCFSFENSPSTLNDLEKFYPVKNYVPRPFKWNNANPNNHIQSSYNTAYGTESNYWHYGGFKYLQTINFDYSNRNNLRLYTSVPKIGFKEQTNFPTRVAWSDKKAVNQQNTPSTKTFYPGNIFDISDNNGEIKFAWSAYAGQQGQNLYAITSNGVALLLVDKRIINDANAQELFSGNAVDEGVISELWLTQTIGMNDEFWRSWAEYNNVLFFCNNMGVYGLTSNQLEFISEQGGFQEIYKNRVLPYIGQKFETKLSGGFNIFNKEYIMTFDENNFPDPNSQYIDLIPSSLIYGVTQQALQCRASYNHDKYLSVGNNLYGMRDGVTFQLGQGNLVNGQIMVASVSGVSAGDKTRYEADPVYMSKEFIRIRVNSNHKPNRILFFDNYENYLNGIVSSTVDSDAIAYSIKDYGGYECYIPRKVLPPYLRQQGRLVLFRIENDSNEDFTVNATMVQFKLLK